MFGLGGPPMRSHSPSNIGQANGMVDPSANFLQQIMQMIQQMQQGSQLGMPNGFQMPSNNVPQASPKPIPGMTNPSTPPYMSGSYMNGTQNPNDNSWFGQMYRAGKIQT